MARPVLTIRRPGTQLALLLTWAVLAALSFPRPNAWILAHFSLVPLVILALRGAPRLRIAWMTWAVATAWWAAMIYWLIDVTGIGYIALAAYMALYPLAFVLLLPRIHRAWDGPLMLTVPVLWVGLEWLRGAYFMTGFPWFLQGQSQPLFMIQSADIWGVYGVSFLVCVTNGFLADVVLRPLMVRYKGLDRPALAKSHIVRICTMSALILLNVGYAAFRVQQTNDLARDRARPALRIAVVQTNEPQSNKDSPDLDDRRQYFQRMMDLARQAAAERPNVIALPETMVPGSLNDEAIRFAREAQAELHRLENAPSPDPKLEASLRHWADYVYYRQTVSDFARESQVALLVGSHAQTGIGARQESHDYNSVYLFGPGGSLEDRYDKVHRVPFGEYLPWVEDWPWAKRLLLKLTPYDFDYSLTPGDRLTVFRLQAGSETWRLAAPICFEDVVTYVPRKMVWSPAGEKRVDVLVNLSNDGWYPGTTEGPQHEQIARFRCIENRVPMARAVNTGVSGFIDSAGRIIRRVQVEGRTQEVAGVATAELMRDDRVTLYGRVGDALPIACVLTSLAWVVAGVVGRILRKETL